MSEPFFARELVAERLSVSPTTLIRYERLGLVRAVRAEHDPAGAEGYGPIEVRRLGTIVAFHRDLGINLAGIEVILRLRDQLHATHARLDRLARDLQTLQDDEPIDADLA